jgi:hypothetical protein
MTLHERAHTVTSPVCQQLESRGFTLLFSVSVRDGWRRSKELRTLAFDDRFFQAYSWPPLREAAPVRGSDLSGQNATKRRSEDVDPKQVEQETEKGS